MDALSSTPTNSSRAPARVFLQLQRHAGNRAVVEQLMKAPRPAGSGAVTGLPSALRRQAEGLSGVDLSDVRVHNHSAAPAALGAAAFTRGNDIFLGHEGDRHLAHEAWHVVQQREGRVPATAQVLGLSANDNPDLEHEADDASREMPSLRDKDVVLRRAGAAPIADVIQGVFIYQPSTDIEIPDRWLDTDSGTVYELVAWHDEGVATVQSMVIKPPQTLVLRLGSGGNWVPSVLTDQEVGEGDVGMEVDETKGPFDAPSGKKVPTSKERAEQALVEKGWRLARLSTDFTVQVDVAPGREGRLSEPKNLKSQILYGPDDVIATGLTVGNKDRPDTYLEPKKAKGGKKAQSNIPQGRHAVAWSFMRRSFAAMAGWSVGQILRHLVTGLEGCAKLLQTEEGQFMLKLTKVTEEPGKVLNVVAELSRDSTRLNVETWQANVSEAIRYYAQVYHLSSGATFAGTSKSRDESGGLRYLEDYEEKLSEGEKATEKPANLQKAAAKLLDVIQTIDSAAYTFAVAHWIELLGDVYPHVMHHHGADIVKPVLETTLAKRYSAEVGGPGTVADLLVFHGYPLPDSRGLPAEQVGITVEGEMEPFGDVYGGSSEFVATVALVEALGEGRQVTITEVGGLQGSKPKVRALTSDEVVVSKVVVSDQDRPNTRFGTTQNSHTVAWTLMRAELATFRNKPLSSLLGFLYPRFGELSREKGESLQKLVKHADVEFSKVRGKSRPIHIWQSDVSMAVKWYAHAHQLAPSTTFYDVQAHGAFGHGEAAHMEVLRACETSAYNENKLVAEPARVYEAAYKLMDVVPALSTQVRRTAFMRWKGAMCSVFPVLMSGIGNDIIVSCVKQYNLAGDLDPSDIKL